MHLQEKNTIVAIEPFELSVTPPVMKKSDPLMIQSVAKCFRVLEAFDEAHPKLTLSEIAQLTSFDLSAVQRFCHTLNKLGYLDKDPLTRQHSLSLKVLNLSYQYKHSSMLVRAAMPVLQHLSRETEETVSLTVLDGAEIVYVARIQSRHVLQPNVISGTRLPAYCSSAGRAILSQLDPEKVAEVLEASDLREHTPHTVTKPAELLKIIDVSRKQGFATGFEEIYLGDASIAAPIVGSGGKVQGAISIATSVARFNPDTVISNYSSLIIAAAHSITT